MPFFNITSYVLQIWKRDNISVFQNTINWFMDVIGFYLWSCNWAIKIFPILQVHCIYLLLLILSGWCCCIVQLPSRVWLCNPMDWSTPGLFVLPISQSLPKFMFIASVMSSIHLILWCPLLLLPSIFLSIRVFSNLSALRIKNTGASASASALPMSILGWFPLRLTGVISFLSKRLSGIFSRTTVQRHQFFSALPSLQFSSDSCAWPLGRPESSWLYWPLLAE